MPNKLSFEIRDAECHDTCLDVEWRPTGHTANVNPVGFSTAWRVDCDHCCTCISIVKTKAEAIEKAVAHVVVSSAVYWEIRDNLYDLIPEEFRNEDLVPHPTI